MELTLDQLVAAVGERITAAGLAQANGQVSPFPDRRTLRYYTTIGLLDRPLAVRDRQALYGERHLLQALAVKRLQADGLALADIQARLSGLPAADVAAIAEGRDRSPRFWAARAAARTASPATASPAMSDALTGNIATNASEFAPVGPIPSPTSPPGSPGSAQTMLAIPLASDISVLIPAGRILTPDELAAIRLAAGPLLDHLAAAGLTGADPKDCS